MEGQVCKEVLLLVGAEVPEHGNAISEDVEFCIRKGVGLE